MAYDRTQKAIHLSVAEDIDTQLRNERQIKKERERELENNFATVKSRADKRKRKNTFGPKLTESENRLINSTNHLVSNRNHLGVTTKKRMKRGHAPLNSRKEMANKDIEC